MSVRGPWAAASVHRGAFVAALLAAAALLGVNLVAVRVARGEAAEPITVQLEPPSAADRGGVLVLARTSFRKDEPLVHTGPSRFTLAGRYVKKLFVVADEATAGRLLAVNVWVGRTVFRFDRAAFLAWPREELRDGRLAWRAPPEVSVTRSALGVVRSGILNWRGDALLLHLVREVLPWVGLFLLLGGAVAFGASAFRRLDRGRREQLAHVGESRAWILLAVLVPFAAVTLISAHHEGDVSNFGRWALAWRHDPRSIYLDSSSDYPIVANLFTALPLSLLAPDPNSEAAHAAFRRVLAGVDAGWLILFAVLLAWLGVRRAALWTAALAVLPSSWAGSSVWGQIEGAGQLLLCGTALLVVLALRAAPARRATLWIALSGAGVGLILVCKQLLVFALPAVLMLTAVAIWRIGQRRRADGALAALAWVGAFVVAAFGWDLWLRLPPPWHSHLALLWLQEGSAHAGPVSLNGFNVWVLDPHSSGSALVPVGSFVPAVAGASLFLAYCVLLAALAWVWRAAIALTGERGAPAWRRASVHGMFLVALPQLAMMLFLVGTADRYLYHFYPFALAALLAARAQRPEAISRSDVVVLLACALLYGLFVLAAFAPLPRSLFFAQNQALLATVHLLLLLRLTRVWVRVLRLDAAPAPAARRPRAVAGAVEDQAALARTES